jgi:D-alanyl-D-alanine carboxypeptidase
MIVGVSGAARGARIGILGLAAMMAFLAVTTDPADARRRKARVSTYSPPYATIVVDANSGKTLQATNADSIRHPASLTKIMTLYLLFERLESGRMKLDSQMPVSEHASEQAPTKLGLAEGSTLMVEDAIKGLVTKSANDAAVVIAETLGGSEDQFARLMTAKARALGMSKTVYRNASGLPDDAQVTTARDQATLGRAIQERFPRYYAYFSMPSFRYRGNVIRNHNRLLGRVEGVDGIKTGYTRASGFNLVTSMKRGNRHIVGVVLGGRSGGSRDAAMRELVAEYIGGGATQKTASVIEQRGTSLAAVEPKPMPVVAAAQKSIELKPPARADAVKPVQLAAAGPALTVAAPAPAPAKTAEKATEPMLLSSGVVATQALPPIPGSSDPITPTRVKTVAVRAGAVKPAMPAMAALPATISEAPAAAPAQTASIPRSELPPPAPNHGTGQGILGVLPASAMAYADPKPAPAQRVAAVAPAPVAAAAPAKPIARSGWIIQVGAYDAESEARQRIDLARGRVKQLGKADPFTEPVAKGDKTMYRARFAGLAKDDAEAACKALKRSDIACFTIKN